MLVDVFLHDTPHAIRDLNFTLNVYMLSSLWWIQPQSFGGASIAAFPNSIKKMPSQLADYFADKPTCTDMVTPARLCGTKGWLLRARLVNNTLMNTVARLGARNLHECASIHECADLPILLWVFRPPSRPPTLLDESNPWACHAMHGMAVTFPGFGKICLGLWALLKRQSGRL